MRRLFVPTLVTGVALCFSLAGTQLFAQQPIETVTVDATAQGKPFLHFWEQMFGSGRAVLAMREDYRNDMRAVKKATDFRFVRFHAIFHDEMGVYDEDAQGHPVYNFSYVDQVYDGLLANGVKPFVEISFTPKKMATRLDYHAFWYKQIVAPPDYSKWDPLIQAFAQHLVDRYGVDEVSQWYFEVWNEPNIDFWTGRPAQDTYFELYDHTVRALKGVNGRLRVGGPATAQAAWVDAMIAHAKEKDIPLDFVSSHVYGNDTARDVFGEDRTIAPHQMVCAAVSKVHDQIKASARPDMPLIWSEFNATYMNESELTDSIYMGPWMANTIRQCDGLVDMMSYWTFSDVFEEQGPVKKPFYGGYGLIAEDSIPKPAFEVFALLHTLGETRFAQPQDDVLVTRRKDGTFVIAAWNLVEPKASGADKTIQFQLRGVKDSARATVRRVDGQHGDTMAAYARMGSPQYPSKAQIAQLREASKAGPPETISITNHSITITVPPSGLAVVEVR